jgi:hypothetical protein
MYCWATTRDHASGETVHKPVHQLYTTLYTNCTPNVHQLYTKRTPIVHPSVHQTVHQPVHQSVHQLYTNILGMLTIPPENDSFVTGHPDTIKKCPTCHKQWNRWSPRHSLDPRRTLDGPDGHWKRLCTPIVHQSYTQLYTNRTPNCTPIVHQTLHQFYTNLYTNPGGIYMVYIYHRYKCIMMISTSQLCFPACTLQ